MIEVGGEKVREESRGEGGRGGLVVVERVKEKGKMREEGESKGTEGWERETDHKLDAIGNCSLCMCTYVNWNTYTLEFHYSIQSDNDQVLV